MSLAWAVWPLVVHCILNHCLGRSCGHLISWVIDRVLNDVRDHFELGVGSSEILLLVRVCLHQIDELEHVHLLG